MRQSILGPNPARHGDTRTLAGFLFRPRRIAGRLKWLCLARRRQVCLFVYDGWNRSRLQWFDFAWETVNGYLEAPMHSRDYHPNGLLLRTEPYWIGRDGEVRVHRPEREEQPYHRPSAKDLTARNGAAKRPDPKRRKKP
jgi:hypothetical protein